MPLPTYDQAMLPILKLLADGAVWTLRQISAELATRLGLTEEERQERIPSGRETVLRSRVHWAVYYAKRAGLLETTKRGAYAITDRGHSVLAENPEKLNAAYLLRFPEFAEWVGKPATDPGGASTVPTAPALPAEFTPDQRLQHAYSEIHERVASELLDRILQGSPRFFEQVVVDLMLAMGYGGGAGPDAGWVTQASNDEGIDGVIKEDVLGLENIYVQAKRYGLKNSVGRPAISEFAGSLDLHRAHKGVFVTTSRFSAEARDYVGKTSSKRIVLIDGQELVQLMIRYGVGVSEERRLSIPRIDLDYFDADSG